MSKKHIIRAWKDPLYRNGLCPAERAAIPANPAGSVEVSDADLGKIAGGAEKTDWFCSIACPTPFCSLNQCSVLGCKTDFISCPVKKL